MTLTPFRVLLIDGDELVRASAHARLTKEGYAVVAVGAGGEAVDQLRNSVFDCAVVEIGLPDMDGIEVLEAIKARTSGVDVVMTTDAPHVDSAVQALRLGAYDYLTKPFEWTSFLRLLQRIVERRFMRSEIISLRTRLSESVPCCDMVGASHPLRRIQDIVTKVAPTDSVVLIQGESGTGKELIAAGIHRLSGRSGSFVPVNCSAIPSELLESELFGHVKGAFSGATADSKGLFRQAHGGTLLLDEIGDMPLQMQPKLLRVLQDKAVRAVGGTQIHKVDVRVVAATNQDLETGVKNGTFREDLFHRLNVVRVESPALRDRKDDIPMLVLHFVRRLNTRFRRQVESVNTEAMVALSAYDFPGNVRELENIIERAYALGADGEITIADLPSFNGRKSNSKSSSAALRKIDDVERELIADTLKSYEDNRALAAKSLGISERSLYRRLTKFGLN